MTARTVHELSDRAYERLCDLADEETERNRVELAKRAQKERELMIEALIPHIDAMTPRQLAELIATEREYELADPELQFFGGVNRTQLALFVRDAAEAYAKDEAEVITAEDLFAGEVANEADAENDRLRDEAWFNHQPRGSSESEKV